MGVPAWQAGLVAFAANLVPAVIIAALRERVGFLARWNPARSGRSRRAADLFRKYGAPGLAFLAPLATGVYLATVVPVVLGVSARVWLLWLGASLSAWAVAAAAVAHAGGALLRIL